MPWEPDREPLANCLCSVQQRALASSLTAFSMGLGVMLLVAVLSIHGIIERSFQNNASLGYNMILGAKGGKLQLTLNTVYYLSQPIENLPYEYYLEFHAADRRDVEHKTSLYPPKPRRDGKYASFVELAIPVCLVYASAPFALSARLRRCSTRCSSAPQGRRSTNLLPAGTFGCTVRNTGFSRRLSGPRWPAR